MRGIRLGIMVVACLWALVTVFGSTAAASGHEQVVDLTFPTDPRAGGALDWEAGRGYTDDYDDPRSGGAHLATDIMGEHGWPVYAAVGGTISFMPETEQSYGWMIRVQGDDGRRYSYVHLGRSGGSRDDAYVAGLAEGDRVERGQHIAFMGSSGNASASAPHLHFAIRDEGVSDPYGSNYLNPYPSLRDAESRGDYAGEDAPGFEEAADEVEEGVEGGDGAAEGDEANLNVGHACPPDQVPDAGYHDVGEGSVHALTVDCAVWWGVAEGADDEHYRPDGSVTRSQMAAFVARLLRASDADMPAEPADHFPDDGDSVHEEDVNALAEIGIVAGLDDERYAPATAVTRGQMATFLVGAYEHRTGKTLGAEGDPFHDDDGSVHEERINAAAAAGLTEGVEEGHYRPGKPVTRAQMATFLSRLLDQLVEEGAATTPG